jgi:hypothetical protein
MNLLLRLSIESVLMSSYREGLVQLLGIVGAYRWTCSYPTSRRAMETGYPMLLRNSRLLPLLSRSVTEAYTQGAFTLERLRNSIFSANHVDKIVVA